MRKHMYWILSCSLLVGAGCATIRSHRTLEQPTGVNLVASPGSTLFRLNKAGDLPNAFGGRDVWGGKVDKGFTEVKLLSIDDTILILSVVDYDRHSTETVMDRYKPFQQQAAVSVDMQTDIRINSPSESSTPVIVRFDTSKGRDIVFGGIQIRINDVQAYTIQYSLADTMVH